MTILEHFKKVSANHQLAHAYIIDQISSDQIQPLITEIAAILQILPQDNHLISSDGNSITVDVIRDITHRLSKSPIGHCHLVAISEADKLNVQACNALLKCLEEPPGNTCFLLFTQNANVLLPTIRSRSQILRMTSKTLDAYKEHQDYELIKAIYELNPSSIDDNLMGIQLYEAMTSSNPLNAIHQLEISSKQLLTLSIQILAYLITKQSSQEKWDAYHQVTQLYKEFQHMHNLNEKALMDRIGVLSKSFK